MDPSEHNVAYALQTASSRDYAEAQAATNQLEAWHKIQGYHSTLQNLFLQQNLPPELRLVALLGLKNGVEKHWRRGSINALNTDEQAHIRSKLLANLFNDAHDSRFVAVQAVVVAKIARNDFPDHWPTFFEDVRRMLEDRRNHNGTRLETLLTTIRHAIKEFGTLRLQKPRQALYSACPTLFSVLWEQYHTRSLEYFEDTAREEQAGIHPQAPAQYFRCIRRLSLIGFDALHESPQVRAVWQFSHEALQRMLAMNAQRHGGDDLPGAVAAHMGQLVKFHLTIAQSHSVSYGLMKDTPELTRLYWERACLMRDEHRSTPNGDPFAEFFCLKALLLLRACFKIAHTPLQTFRLQSNREQAVEARSIIKTQILSVDFISRLFDGLVSKFFLYAQGDVEEWLDEAEEWEIKESDQDDAYELSSRPCAERLLVDATLNYKAIIAPRLFELVADYSASDEVFAKDAVYAALGATAAMIHEAFDFNNFLTQRLKKDLKDSGPTQNLIRRRIAILLSQWTPVAVSSDNKILVYSMFAGLLDPSTESNDQVVRITAGKRFKEIGDDFGFLPEAFAQHAPKLLQAVVDLVREVTLPETQLALLATLQVIVERMEHLILPFADQIVALLAPLWQELEKEQEMKKAVLGVLNMLVRSLGSDSTPLQSLLLPIVTTALMPGSETQLYLLEDSLVLLDTIADQASSSSPELLSVVHLLLPILELETSLCAKTLEILDKLVLLDPHALVQEGARRTSLLSLCPLLSVRSDEVVGLTVRYIEHLIRASHTYLGENGAMTLAEELSTCGISRKALDCVHGCYAAHQTRGPKRKDPPSDARNETFYFILLARLILTGNKSFVGTVQSWCTEKGREFDSAVSHILIEWFSHMDNVGDSTRTKLMSLALTQLLDTQASWVLGKLQDLMALWTSQVLDLRDGDDDTSGDCLVYPPLDAEAPSSYYNSPHQIRLARSARSDPVHMINLGQFVKHHLLEVITRCDGEAMFRETWLLDVDADLLKSFEDARIMQ